MSHPINFNYCLEGVHCKNIRHFETCPRKHLICEKNWSSLGHRDKEYLKKITDKATTKSENRITNCLLSISKLQSRERKKYQYKEDKYELKRIVEYIKLYPNLDYDLIKDNSIYVNKLTKIKPGLDSDCCSECDGTISFTNKKIPPKYISVVRLP
uniref:Uncharacterized protein n=1 Tax=viral metagenome TaxID=1070528 RepID=A0A6C0J4W0_9ZZZZ